MVKSEVFTMKTSKSQKRKIKKILALLKKQTRYQQAEIVIQALDKKLETIDND